MLRGLLAVAAVTLATSSFASPQTEKMSSCMKEAHEKGLKGEEFKKFRSECLSAKDVSTSQQDKMRSCMHEAKEKGLKGEEFKKFRSECLSK